MSGSAIRPSNSEHKLPQLGSAAEFTHSSYAAQSEPNQFVNRGQGAWL